MTRALKVLVRYGLVVGIPLAAVSYLHGAVDVPHGLSVLLWYVTCWWVALVTIAVTAVLWEAAA